MAVDHGKLILISIQDWHFYRTFDDLGSPIWRFLAAVAVLYRREGGGMPTQRCLGGHRHYATW